MTQAQERTPDQAIALAGVAKTYASGVEALTSTDLDIGPGQFVSLVGPSGCGKSTLLRIIAGLELPSAGQVSRDGQPGDLAFVFQEAALLPWRTALENAALRMELEGIDPQGRARRAREALELVGLKGFEDRYPDELSGGMRMRLSLAGAVALRAHILLLDEPLAAVDELTREELQEELSMLWRVQKFTALMITHSVAEAAFLSTRILVMSPHPGRVLCDQAVPFSFPRTPELRATPEFARFVGQVSALLRQSKHTEAA